MRLAVSNIAWGAEDEEAVLVELRRGGVEGIEIAPTRLWPEWAGATAASGAEVRRALGERGFVCAALQAVFFGLPQHTLFGSAESRRGFVDHLLFVAELAHALGAGAVVLGSPQNRRAGDLPREAAWAAAVDTFRRVAPDYAGAGVTLCVEPNPPEYGCDFITTTAEAVALARDVAAEGFAINLDAGTILLTTRDAGEARAARGHVGHVHVSEPYLERVAAADALHRDLGRALDESGYTGWRSIEMRRQEDAVEAVAVAIGAARAAYFADSDEA